MIFIIMNSLVLFVIMQILGVPISNLALLKQKYDTFSFSEDKTTSGINIIYNIFISNIYILLLNEMNIAKPYVNNLYFVVIGYLLIRYFVIFFILQRKSLLNFRYEFTLVTLTLLGTYIVFDKFIRSGISIMIPIDDFKNEIVLLLILFLYDIFKNSLVTVFKDRDVTSRREKYIRNRYSYFFDKYNSYILSNIGEEFKIDKEITRKFILLVYSFIIYENFSRPKFYRLVEFVVSKFSSGRYSTGIMQVQSKYTLDDKESIAKGIDILKNMFIEIESYEYEECWVREIANRYNPSNNEQYAKEILYIYIELDRFLQVLD
ncbi:hypothetical protein JZO76_12740 [Enterococcus sp. MJM12]|uniref:Transglycosylase SLT domain-containing protein n=1 Tax=Candidatus Enterococcus myersii TaxID=2815322 RepID=A0ABS3HAA4_9ENTE|nr:hypothetical protein [Enterococcus sp. MJM12]MBO0450387.1 hypothetical protein [Enterococcus sp. MJM12]